VTSLRPPYTGRSPSWPAIGHPCPHCGEVTPGGAVGALCQACEHALARQASLVGRVGALVTTLLLSGYLVLALRSVPAARAGTARLVGATAVAAWYLLTARIVRRIASEWLRATRS